MAWTITPGRSRPATTQTLPSSTPTWRGSRPPTSALPTLSRPGSEGGSSTSRTDEGALMVRTRMAVTAIAALSVVGVLAACGRSAGDAKSTDGNINPLKGLVTTTAPGTKQVSSVTWAVYRDVNSLAPIFAFDYPENTAVSLLCESLLRQAPDGAVGPGLATLSAPSPTQFVLTLKSGVHFWDGSPV